MFRQVEAPELTWYIEIPKWMDLKGQLGPVCLHMPKQCVCRGVVVYNECTKEPFLCHYITFAGEDFSLYVCVCECVFVCLMLRKEDEDEGVFPPLSP